MINGRAVPLRTHNCTASREVELVVHEAIDDDHAHRYCDISAFDLDNLIELRPIGVSSPSASFARGSGGDGGSSASRS